ncbi:hypothetical protein [Nitrincola alkalilacustris]|uniref:hypothetical protein n=1 Tax=Nitrincola alkalilacustris TaxID=1571224 RepID=UPI00124D6CF0|nr:hypothetical protein [Nitrincola alkalilacustris]
MSDRHNTRRIRNLLAIAISAFFAVVGVAGYQRTGDPMQLLLFLALAVVSLGFVLIVFKGIDKLLDSMDTERRD